MPSTGQLQTLRLWLEDNGGYVNPAIDLDRNETAGVHCRVKSASSLGPDSRICTVPHSLALSSLNALVDDSFPVFRDRGLAPEAIGYFYLMHQYINKAQSFWRPYLQTLPGPESEHLTPFWFEDEHLQWLADTDVLHTTKARQKLQEEHYVKGIDMLKKAKLDVEPYTWPLFKWAVTIFTSRSFSSRALRPLDSKYWAAYKVGPQGQRQTALVDMSRVSAEDQDFPVLFPVIDVPNHSPTARVDWAFDPGRFSITIKDPIPGGEEVYNNYGPKSNDELLLGYGFCIPDNSDDKVLLTLKPPPSDLQADIRPFQPGYFSSTNAQWSSEKATFGIQRLSWSDGMSTDPVSLFQQLPEPLLELMLYILRHTRGLPFVFQSDPLPYLTGQSSSGTQYLPFLARMIVQSLAPKLATLQASTPPSEPANKRQNLAKVYRNGQISILTSVMNSLRSYLCSLLPSTKTPTQGPGLYTLETLLGLFSAVAGREQVDDFLTGIAANAGTDDVDQLRQAGWEDDMLVLLLCFAYPNLWSADSLPKYVRSVTTKIADQASDTMEEELAQAQSAMDIVRVAAEACPGTRWCDEKWNAQFVASVGGRILAFESFAMVVPSDTGEDEVRSVVHVHREA
ncbi:hypothetical protein TI39_contig4150g00009 [Zymoseptoria brevis]|uniref:Uncharacterized protein n=1 Tax=Zymoseptoria brevis TaxID=1047168 RepID=A0A0F4GBY5_9PEZI|nr:hypothetical protein TI39_contig4150g00009 [Zymoseptoria brevis]